MLQLIYYPPNSNTNPKQNKNNNTNKKKKKKNILTKNEDEKIGTYKQHEIQEI